MIVDQKLSVFHKSIVAVSLFTFTKYLILHQIVPLDFKHQSIYFTAVISMSIIDKLTVKVNAMIYFYIFSKTYVFATFRSGSQICSAGKSWKRGFAKISLSWRTSRTFVKITPDGKL